MMPFERRAPHDLPETDFQLLESVQRHLVRKEAVDNSRQAKLVEVNFNRDFPKARIADEAILLRDYFASFLREFGAVLAPPEKCVGIQKYWQDENRNYMYSAKSASGSSKSGAIQMPLPVPGARLAGLIATIFTTGRFSF